MLELGPSSGGAAARGHGVGVRAHGRRPPIGEVRRWGSVLQLCEGEPEGRWRIVDVGTFAPEGCKDSQTDKE